MKDSAVIQFNGWRVPPGFKSDGCTFAKDGRWSHACVLHDFLRRYAIVSKSQADAILYKQMMKLGAGRIRASLYWLGARITAAYFKRTYPLPHEWEEYAKPVRNSI